MTSSKQNPSQDHHHAPQFYLGQWTDADGLLWRYNRVPTGKLIEQRCVTKSTGFEKHLYTARPATPIDNWKPDVIETDFMSPIDNDASKVLPKLIAGTKLNADEKMAWARFLNSLLERHPIEMAERDAKAADIAAKLSEEWKERFAGTPGEGILARVNVPEIARTTVRNFMVQQIKDPRFLDHLVNDHTWCVLTPPYGQPFITSDRPLSVNAALTETRPIYTLTLALGPQHIFFSHPTTWLSDPTLGGTIKTVAAIHNLIVITRPGTKYLYAHEKIIDGGPVRLRTAVENAFDVPSKAPPG